MTIVVAPPTGSPDIPDRRIVAPVDTGLLRRPVESQKGVWSWVTTVDHKRIGIMYGVASLFFFAVGGLEALLMRLQLARPNGDVL